MNDTPAPHGPDDPGPSVHGTRTAREPGELLAPGHGSNFGSRRTSRFVDLTATFDAAV